MTRIRLDHVQEFVAPSGKVYRYFGFPPDQYDELQTESPRNLVHPMFASQITRGCPEFLWNARAAGALPRPAFQSPVYLPHCDWNFNFGYGHHRLPTQVGR